MLIFGYLNSFPNTFWRWYLVFKIPNTFCVFKYHHDKTQQINFCYLFVSKLQVKCSLSYYVIIILSQHDISKPMLKELHPHGLMH